jgi:MFS family permease
MTTAVTLSAAERRRSIAGAIGCAAVFTFTLGMTVPLMSLILERDGWDETVIGLNAATYAVSMVLFAPLVPRVIRTLGAVPVMAGSLVINAATILLLAAFRDIAAWFALRVLMGVTIGALFAVSEAWVNQVAAGEARGRTASVYIIVSTAGLASGPLVIPLVGIEGWTPFVVAFALVIVATLPLVWAWPLAPTFGSAPSIGAWAFLRAAPRLMAAVALVGIFFGTIEPLLPVYGVKEGMSLTGAVAMLSVVVIGNMVLLYPIGWLADRFAPGPIMVLCGTVLLAGSAALPFVTDTPALLWPVLLIWGGGAGGLYAVAMTVLGRRYAGADLVAGAAAFTMFYGIGNLAGPALGGAAMDLWGPIGLPLVLAAACLVFVILAAVRQIAPPAPAE